MENVKASNYKLEDIQIVNRLVTKADLEKFKQDLLFSLMQAMKTYSAKPNKKWIKSYELRKILNVSVTTMQTLRCNGTIPFIKIGHVIYYDMEDVERVFDEKKRHYLKGVLPPLRK